MQNIVFLTDYKGFFGSKYDADPYNSGFDLVKFKYLLAAEGINSSFIAFGDADRYPQIFWKDKIVFYTSSEDVGYYYKSFIEDIILYLEDCGAHVIPSFRFLRANNNKVYMELYRNSSGLGASLKTHVFGCLEELIGSPEMWNYPVIIKLSEGAMSQGVEIAFSRKDLVRKLKKMTRTSSLSEVLHENIRAAIHQGYTRESNYRRKFILQEFVSGLDGDYKVLSFGEKYYCLKRHTRKNDFRASGSGQNYNFGNKSGITPDILDYSEQVVCSLKLPFSSLDIVSSGGKYHLLEFQAIYFGTSIVCRSNGYFSRLNGIWTFIEEKKSVEEVFTHSIAKYFGK